MTFFQRFSVELSKITGISSAPILLVVYTVVAATIIDLAIRGLMFLNFEINNDEKSIYKFNKKMKIFK